MGHGADEFTILQDRRAAHSLDDAAGGGKQLGVGDLNTKVAIFGKVIIDLGDLNGIGLWGAAADGAEDLRLAHLNLVFEGNGIADTAELGGGVTEKSRMIIDGDLSQGAIL